MNIIKNSIQYIIQERKTIDHLHIEFDEEDPDDIKGKYSHKIYGYLLPLHSGKETHVLEREYASRQGSCIWGSGVYMCMYV